MLRCSLTEQTAPAACVTSHSAPAPPPRPRETHWPPAHWSSVQGLPSSHSLLLVQPPAGSVVVVLVDGIVVVGTGPSQVTLVSSPASGAWSEIGTTLLPSRAPASAIASTTPSSPPMALRGRRIETEVAPTVNVPRVTWLVARFKTAATL